MNNNNNNKLNNENDKDNNYKFAIVKNENEFYNNDNEFSLDINKIHDGRKTSINALKKRSNNLLLQKISDKKNRKNSNSINEKPENPENENEDYLKKEEEKTNFNKAENREKFMKKITKINENFKTNFSNSKGKDSNNPIRLNESFLNSSHFIKISNLNKDDEILKNMNLQQNNNNEDSNFININNNNSIDNNITYLYKIDEIPMEIAPDNSIIDMSLADNNYTFIYEKINGNNNNDNENNDNENNILKNLPVNFHSNERGFFTSGKNGMEEKNKFNQEKKILVPRKNKELNVINDSYLDFMDDSYLVQENAKNVHKYEDAKENNYISIDNDNNNNDDEQLVEISLEISPKKDKNRNNLLNNDNNYNDELKDLTHGRINEEDIEKEMDISYEENNENEIVENENNENEIVENENNENENMKNIENENNDDNKNFISLNEIKIIEKEKENNLKDYLIYEFKENNNDNKNQDLKEKIKSKEKSLRNLYWNNLINTWKKNIGNQFDKLNKGIKNNQYFKNKIYKKGLREKDYITEKNTNMNFIKGLSIYEEEVKKINIIKEKINFLEINDLLIDIDKIKQPENFNYEIIKKEFYEELNNNNNNNNVKKEFFEEKIKGLKLNKELKNKYGDQLKIIKLDSIESFDKRNFCLIEENKDKDKNINIDIEDSFSEDDDINNIYEENENNNNSNNDLMFGIFTQRESFKDGNSFYRMFMFNLIENLILHKKTKMLSKIFLNMFFVYKDLKETNEDMNNENKHKFIFNNIDIIKCRMLFNFIINYMRIKDYSKAYDFLIKGFNMPCGSFDKVN
jgi:hypothetical protein